MKESRLQQMLRSRAYHRKWVVVFLVLALMVTAGVSAVLHKTGVAAVYTKRVMHCPYAELSGQVAHIHATDCYDADGNLVCPLQEIAPHTHTEECYSVLRDLVCGQEENPGHIHDDSCYTMTRGELLCTDESPDHEHTDACYEMIPTLSCGLEEGEGAHVHSDACYYEIQRTITCGLQELPEHVHDANCFIEVELTDEEKAALGLLDEEDGLAAALDATGEEDPADGIIEANPAESGSNDAEHIEKTQDEEPEDENTAAEETGAELVMPPASFEETAGDVRVIVEADEGVFPEGTTMTVEEVVENDVLDAVSGAVEGKVMQVKAVDITFKNANGEEIQPAKPIRVRMEPINGTEINEAAESAKTAENENFQVVHVDAAGKGEVVETPEELTEDEVITAETENAVFFDAEHFSVYAFVYTVVVDYEVDGQHYSASIDGADDMLLSDILQKLGGHYPIENVDTVYFTNPELVRVTRVEGDWSIRPMKDTTDEDALVVSTKDMKQFSIRITTQGRTEADAGIAVISTVDETFLPKNAVASAEALDEARGEGAIAAVQSGAETLEADVEEPAAEEAQQADDARREETVYQVFDISLENVNPEDYKDGFHVALTLPENIVGRDFHLYHIHDAVVEELSFEKEAEPTENGMELLSSVQFETGSFSEFVLQYTVDFHYTVNGKTYEFSIPGGGFLSFEKLVEALGLAAGGDGDMTDADVSATEEDISETEPISLDSIVVSEETRHFVADVAGIAFSSPELVWVGYVGAETTVGQLKAENNLMIQYSAELTDEQITAINSTPVEAGDWALISLKPFDTEETLAVTMKNGDVFTIQVTDAHSISATSEIDVNNSYIICYEDTDGYHVLKADGTTETLSTNANFDKLDSSYRWMFNYVFEEKDREGTLTYTYYLVRPISHKGSTIALNTPNDPDGLIQNSNNNVAVVPQQGGGFRFIGYNDVHLHYENNAFSGKTGSGSLIQIYQMDTLPKYDYTVRSNNETMGTVTVSDGTMQTEQHGGEDDTHYYAAETKERSAEGKYYNAGTIKATPVEHKNNQASAAHRIENKWKFDHWELNGTRLEGYGDTINAEELEVPYNGSNLVAVFKNNPDYEAPDHEKEGSSFENMMAWLNELKNRKLPLDESSTNKTAEVYDYENRIYRVDLTTRANLTTFDGTVDMGFILDVSGSMNFPSYLYTSSDSTGIRDLSQINNTVGPWYNQHTQGEDWGLDTEKTYYIIADPDGTATVCYLYFGQGNKWWLCDASKDRFNYSSNGPFNPQNGYSVDDKQHYGDSYYKTTTYQILEAGDRVTATDMMTDGALLSKLGLQIGDPKTRAFYLEKSLNGTIAELNEILGILSVAGNQANNPDVKIAWNTFRNFLPNGSGQLQHQFVSASGGVNLNYDYNTYGGGTSTDAALLDAAGVNRNDISDRYSDTDRKNWDTDNNVNHTYTFNPSSGFQWENSATKYAVLITDGAPQRNGKSITRRYVEEAANQLKNRGVELITVGLGMENVVNGKILLYDIADTDNNGNRMFYSAKSGDELQSVLLQIVRTIMTDATVIGNVTDTVGDAFYPVDKATGMPLSAGNKIDLAGNKLNDNYNGPDQYGIITYDNATDRYGVSWTNQNFPSDVDWHGSVYVKAKEDLLGGNAVQTNYGNAKVQAVSYKTSPEKNPVLFATSQTEKLKTLVIGGENSDKLTSPRVNVNELSFNGNDSEWTVYLGTQVDPKEQLKKLWDDIHVEEVVKKDHAVDNDNNGLPELGANSTDNNWYPLIESIEDDRETDITGEKQTFKMNDLIKALAQGKSFNWWDYTKNEPKWDDFLTQVLNEGGIVIPYDVYSLRDNDSSTLSITLTKEILSGEESDIITRSPHVTTVVNDTADDGSDVPTEKYHLTVKYSPDYNIVPVGQGGSGHLDYHTGTFGTMYQGHAAGTETSENTHVINVYAEPMDVLKVDDHNAAVPGATFSLYRVAKTDETGVTLSEYNDSLTGSYYCISTGTSGADGVVHLAPDDTATPTHTIPVAAGQTAQNLLVPGETYYLIETTVPTGYKSENTVMTITVETGPELFTKLDKITPVEPTNIGGNPARPVIPYNWNEGVTFKVGELESSEDPAAAEMANHDTHQVITLPGGREYMLRSDSESSAIFQIKMLNTRVTSIDILKVGGNDSEGLSGAVFELKAVGADGHSWGDPPDIIGGIGTVTKIVNGATVTFENAFETTDDKHTLTDLPDGTYRLYEVYVPAGYVNTLQYIEFTISNHNLTLNTTSNQVSDKAAGVNTLALMTIRNEPGVPLPMTGGIGSTIFTVLGGPTTAIAGAALMMTRLRRKREDS